jgi:hypothetical protein
MMRTYKAHVQEAERALFQLVRDMQTTHATLGCRLIGGNSDKIAEAKTELEQLQRAVLAAAIEWQELADDYDAWIDFTRRRKAGAA